MVDPVAAIENEEDFIVWTNTNGDYFLDHNEQPNSTKAWVCNDFNVAPEVYKMDSDAAGWISAMTNYIGAVSFGILGPDGTGAGYFAYAGETANRYKGTEVGGTMFLQNGSAFDGIYTDNYASNDSTKYTGTHFIGHDSAKGTIAKQISVSESAPTAFTVAQNVPNPFNPSTTISFVIPKTEMVTIDVYNIAGQKMATLANARMSVGEHSVTWNASKFSSGQYFYTVKCGEYSRTMRMTLLK